MTYELLQQLEINRAAFAHNVKTFRSLLKPGCRMMAVVKSNAYGHGLLPVAELAGAAGVDALGVNSLEEGVRLREAGCRLPCIILGYTLRQDLGEAVRLELEPVLYNPESLEQLQREAVRYHRRAVFHLKLETGVHRQGVMEKDMDGFLDLLQRMDRTDLQSVSMHFANIEDTTDHSFARHQLDNFLRLHGRVTARLGRRPALQAACTAAALLFPETHFDMIRTGIGIYGLWPSKETYLSALLLQQHPPVLKPVLSWKTRVAQLKEVPAGEFVGYGCTFRATHALRLAVLPVGYYDGYDRRLSGTGYVLAGGVRAPVLGRVCMNMIMVDVTHVPAVRLEDEVVLLGSQNGDRVSAEDLAGLCHTINYEMVSRLGAHIPRRVV